MTRTDRILDSGATPMIPPVAPPPWPWPAIREAIQVPCTPQNWLPGEVRTPV
jgi:hypothetical protein